MTSGSADNFRSTTPCMRTRVGRRYDGLTFEDRARHAVVWFLPPREAAERSGAPRRNRVMATDRQEVRSGQSLRRALGRTSATFLTAAMIIGTGLFAALGAT